MLFVCWMPWANVSCGDVRTRPNLWQLADYEPMLYVYPALAAVIIILGVVYIIRHHRGLAIASTVVALAAAAAWIYFLIRRDEMIAQQMAMQELGGNLGQMMKDIQQDPGNGFRTYPLGFILALLSSAWSVIAGQPQKILADRDPAPPGPRRTSLVFVREMFFHALQHFLKRAYFGF